MFHTNPTKKNLIVGEVVIVGGLRDNKFVPIKTTAKVESITPEEGGRVRIDLDWGPGFGKSKVYAHDEGSVWVRASDFN